MKRINLFLIAVFVFSFLTAFLLYPFVPENMASHWNIQGEPDGFMPKLWGLFLFPLIFLGMGLLFLAIPKMDPLNKNIDKFRKYYDGFIVVFFLFMLMVYLQSLLWNLGYPVEFGLTLPVGIGVLFFYIGFMFEKTKRNWFIGIRTPWTLSSDRVWDKTHRLGAKLFKISGLLAMAGVFFADLILWFIIIPVFLATGITVAYSYLEYQKEKK